MKQLFVFAFVVLHTVACQAPRSASSGSINPYQYTITKKVVASKAAVVSAHPLASQVGVLVMKDGGNAVDAAIATQLALAVVYPNAGNLGGGGFMVARLQNGQTVALDYRETAPGAAHRDMYLDANGEVVPDKSVYGHLSAGVPGTVAGLMESMKYAKLPFQKLIQPAILLAEKGFVVTDREARSLNSIQGDLKQYNTMPTAFQKVDGWKAGDTLFQPELGATLRRISTSGAAGFYEGRTAELIVEEMKRGGGLITLEDLKAYKAKWR